MASKFQKQPLGITFKHYTLCNTLLWEKNMSGVAQNGDYKVTNSCQWGLKLLSFLCETGDTEQVGQQRKMWT